MPVAIFVFLTFFQPTKVEGRSLNISLKSILKSDDWGEVEVGSGLRLPLNYLGRALALSHLDILIQITLPPEFPFPFNITTLPVVLALCLFRVENDVKLLRNRVRML